MNISALVLAAGSSSRFGGDVPKVFMRLGTRTVLERSLARVRALLQRLNDDRPITLAVRPEDRATHLPALQVRLQHWNVQTIDGGSTRQDSMRRALAAGGAADLVLVHDAARPFFSIEAGLDAVRLAHQHGAAILAAPMNDTLKRVDADGRILQTVDRTGMRRAQTPQVIRYDLLLEALQTDAELTDDVALLEQRGHPVFVVESSDHNLKITTKADLELAQWLAEREDQQA